MRSATPSYFTGITLKLNETNLSTKHVVIRAGLEPATSRLQVRHPNHTARLPSFGCINRVKLERIIQNVVVGHDFHGVAAWDCADCVSMIFGII